MPHLPDFRAGVVATLGHSASLSKSRTCNKRREHTETNPKTRPWNAESLVTMFKLTPTQEERLGTEVCLKD